MDCEDCKEEGWFINVISPVTHYCLVTVVPTDGICFFWDRFHPSIRHDTQVQRGLKKKPQAENQYNSHEVRCVWSTHYPWKFSMNDSPESLWNCFHTHRCGPEWNFLRPSVQLLWPALTCLCCVNTGSVTLHAVWVTLNNLPHPPDVPSATLCFTYKGFRMHSKRT